MNWYRNYPSAEAKPVKGGIKAATKRGGFGETWWGKRWVEAIEDAYLSGRLDRGKAYARKGQVISLRFTTDFSDSAETATIQALVQGSDADPYEISIALTPFPQKTWNVLLGRLHQQPLLMAKLLTGHLPEAVEEILAQAKCFLLPQDQRDLKTDCSCPDFSNPCKHIAAVYYLVAEAVDRDPFVLFHLRGKPRDVLVRHLEGYMKESPEPPQSPKTAEQPQTASRESSETNGTGKPLSHQTFWHGAKPVSELPSPKMIPPAVSAIIPKRLGNFPFWRGEKPFMEEMERIYATVSKRAAEQLSNLS